ncbi:hypothetical protein OO17_10530, partial [Rhodopseudomonas palustris]
MSTRALSSAAVVLLIGTLLALQTEAQAQNLEAGKSAGQIFAGSCTACHKSPRGLLKTVPPGSLTSFLRQHYTTSSNMAGLLSGYLISNGATDKRYGDEPARERREERAAKPESRPEPVQAEERPRRRQRPAVQETAKPDTATESEREAATSEPDKPAAHSKRKRGHKGKRHPEAPAAEAAKETSKKPTTESAKDSAKSESRKDEPAKTETAKPGAPSEDTAKTGETKSDEAKDGAKGAAQPEAKPARSKSEDAKSEDAKSEDA